MLQRTKNHDVYGHALTDYQEGTFQGPLVLHNSYGEPEVMPVEVFFRTENDFSLLESYALELCFGRILDVGAGAGVHSAYLQNNGYEVVAMDSSSLACQVMRDRGIQEVVGERIMDYHPAKPFDSILVLMNGIGIFETLEGVKAFMDKAGKLLTEQGRIILDSSNIAYLYADVPYPDHYYGQVVYQYEYKGVKGQPFPWLYVDQETLVRIADESGWHCQVVFEGDEDDFLAVLQPAEE